MELLDQLGYDSAWIAEPHSADPEIIASLEVFIAAAAERTRHIRLGTCVSTLSHHHPLAAADQTVPISIAAQVAPSGASVAGTQGLGLLSLSATSPGGFNALAATWEIYQRKATANDQSIDRSRWSLVGPVHIAESREQAFENVQYGIDSWVTYFTEFAAIPIAPNSRDTNTAQALVDSGIAVIGTAQDAIAQIGRLQKQSGGFGTFLQMAHSWADWEQTRKSYQLFARDVAPVFQSSNKNRAAS